MNEFLILLQAKLDEAKSKGLINSDIGTLQNQLDTLKLKAEIDPKTILNLKRQIEKATNQSITFSNISLNSGQIEKTGQQIGSSINKGLMASLGGIRNSIYNVIKQFNSNKLSFSELSKAFNLNRADIDSSVLQQVRDLTKEINALSKEVMKTGSDSSWESITNKINSLYSVLNQFGKTRDLTPFKESLDILKQFQGKKIFVNSESELFQNTGMKIRELNNQFRSLNVTFTTSKKNAVDLDTVWSELCNTSPNLEKFISFGDQISAIVEHLKVAKQALHSDGSLQPIQGNDVSKMLIEYMDRLGEASNKLGLLREQETEIKQNAVSTADTVIQNEERKQQAYKQTADIQKQLLAGESLIKSGANVMMFDNTNDAARQASQYFKELLQDEQTLISVSEKFDKSNQLSSFAVNVRRASGEVETLRYALENIGSKGDPTYVFKNIGAELNNAQAIKQMQQMDKVITDYETKLNDFKTRYSKTSIDFSGFESVFNNFKNGIGTVNDLKIAFNQLENSAKMGMQSLKSQSASLDPIQQALNNMRDMPTMLKTLETNMSGLQNKTGLVGISVDDLTSRYMKLKSEMDAAGGKVPLDGSWAKEYQKLMSDVVASTKRVAAEQKKAEKSNQSFFASLKKNFSFLSYWTSANYIFMTSIRKIKEMVGSVRELQEALVNINYTMELSGRQLKEIGESSLQMAKDLYTSASNILGAVKLYANAKESTESILQKAQPAIMLSNVTGFSGEESAKYLQTIMNQFDLTQDDLMGISDTIQAISQSIAHDFADGIVQINEGIATSGEVARAAGMDLSEYAGMIGLLVEKTGLQGSQLGNSLKTIITRTTKAGKIMGIDEGEISDAEKSLRSVGIEVRKTDGEFKDFNITMGELSKQWESLSDVEKSNISFNLAGTRQINVIQTLLRNWSDYEDLVNKANNSTGVTLENQEKYAASLEGKLGELSAIWSNISNDTISSSFLKGLADAGIGVSSLIEKIGLLKSVMASVGIAVFVKNFNHLKEVGASISALNAIQNVFNDTTLVGEQLNLALAGSLNAYSVETVKAAIAQSTLSETQIRAILVGKGLTGQLLENTTAELAQVTTTNALAVSEGVATTATVGLGNAFKGLGASMKAFALSNPILTAIAAIGVTVYGVVKAYDALTISVEEANEAMDEAITEYDSAKSSLESINSELEEQNKQLDELLSKDKLTYAEKGQLEELQAITKELLLQQDIEQRRAANASKEAADKAVDAYEKQYGRYDKTEEDLQEKLSYENFPLPEDADDVLGMIAAYIRAQELLEQSQKEFDDAVKNGEDTTWLADDVQFNIDAVDDYRQALDENISDLQEKRLALENEYNKAIEKRESGIEPLTSSEKDVIKTYESIYDVMRMVYEYTDKNTWKSMQIESVFDTEGIEKTKEELIEMVKAGEFDESTLQSYPKLSAALEQNKVSASELRNELEALADAEGNVKGDIFNDKNPISLSITDTVDQLNTQLKPAFDSLQSAWKDIFTTDDNGKPLFSLDDVDLSTFDSIKSELDEMSKLGLSVDYSAFEDFVNVLNNTESTEQNVQDAFNSLATSITQAALSGAEDFNTMRAALEDLGVINNELVAFDAMISNTEALKEAGLDLAHATDEQIAAFANEFVAAENVTQAIAMLTFHKELCNLQEMNTAGEVANLKTLAENAGYTGEVIQYLTELEQIYQEVASGTITPIQIGVKVARAAMLKAFIDNTAGNINYEPKVDFTKATDSAKKAGKKAGKKTADAYLEAFEKELEKLQGMRDRNEITEKEYLDRLRVA